MQMKLAVAAFTRVGGGLADWLCDRLALQGYTITHNAFFGKGMNKQSSEEQLSSWTNRMFSQNDGLIFVGACGIAVRAIAPFIKDKMSDPAVVSVDQQGRFAIALLSGHVGGAGELAQAVAQITGGVPVVSTATDLCGCFAVDVWATQYKLEIKERKLVKEVSAALLDGKLVGFYSDLPVAGALPKGLISQAQLGICVSKDFTKKPFEHTLHLIPRWLVLGIGCRKNVAAEQLEQELLQRLAGLGETIESVGIIATIEHKREEPCIKVFCEKYKLTLLVAPVEELKRQQGAFSSSEFVQKTVGVDNVCERAVVWTGARIISAKFASNGVTTAVGIMEMGLAFPTD